MFVEAEQLTNGARIETDICILGAGAAGISLARELDGSGFEVCLIESGGFDYEMQVQDLYRGDISGRSYYPLHATRLRMFGGSTNHWGGFSRQFDDIDFEPRPWVKWSGWPFGLDELQPYYARAHRTCELGPPDYSVDTWTRPYFQGLALENTLLQNGVFQNSTPTRFGETYRAQIEASENIRAVLHATATNIALHPDGRRVKRVELATLSGKRFFASAKRYVIALGGIENPRLLLNSNDVLRNGIGNGRDLVGRYFMEHPIMPVGELLVTDPDSSTDLYRRRNVDGTAVHGFITVRPEILRARKMINCGVLLQRRNWGDSSDGPASVKHVMDKIASGRVPDELLEHVANIVTDLDGILSATYNKLRDRRLFNVIYWAESVPNPDSRVKLSADTDPFGKRRVDLDWRLTEQDRENLRNLHAVLAQELGRTGLGRLHLSFDADADAWPEDLVGSHHHMGTTRMAESPDRGVVDGNCRVHGIENLYVAGSSVFPTAGQANPTLTLVALAIRLADHLRRDTA